MEGCRLFQGLVRQCSLQQLQSVTKNVADVLLWWLPSFHRWQLIVFCHKKRFLRQQMTTPSATLSHTETVRKKKSLFWQISHLLHRECLLSALWSAHLSWCVWSGGQITELIVSLFREVISTGRYKKEDCKVLNIHRKFCDSVPWWGIVWKCLL